MYFVFSTVKVEFKYMNEVANCKIPHFSNSFNRLQEEAKAKFNCDLAEIDTDDIYFEELSNNKKIENAFHFTTLINNSDQNSRNKYTFNLEIRVKNRKAYSDWEIEDVLQKIYEYPCNDLEMVQYKFDMESLPQSSPPLSNEI